MASVDLQAQQEEILVMESIFDKNTFRVYSSEKGANPSGEIIIRLDLPEPFFLSAGVSINSDAEKPQEYVANIQQAKYKIEYVPPLTLRFSLPANYPSEAQPKFNLNSDWLHNTQLSVLCGKLDKIWDENKGIGVLFTWTNYIQTQALSDLGITDVYDVFVHDTAEHAKSLIDHLLKYNEEQIMETFLKTYHECEICFTMKMGDSCVRFLCGHIFCKNCVAGYFSTKIMEGTMDQVKCLALNCQIRPETHLIKELVGESDYQRYENILLKRTLESMKDVIYCPRKNCNSPVICEADDKCAFCTVCRYNFCSTCKMCYHGVEPCRGLEAEMGEIFENELGDKMDEPVKPVSKKQLKKRMFENGMSEKWIEKETKPCPHCGVPIQKNGGCNEVICSFCTLRFCWIYDQLGQES